MAETFEGWAVVELMGHRKLAGYVKEQSIAGAGFLRLDVPGGEDGKGTSKFYAPAAVYCITPMTELLARLLALNCQPAPVQRYELPALPAAKDAEMVDGDDGSGDEADDAGNDYHEDGSPF